MEKEQELMIINGDDDDDDAVAGDAKLRVASSGNDVENRDDLSIKELNIKKKTGLLIDDSFDVVRRGGSSIGDDHHHDHYKVEEKFEEDKHNSIGAEVDNRNSVDNDDIQTPLLSSSSSSSSSTDTHDRQPSRPKQPLPSLVSSSLSSSSTTTTIHRSIASPSTYLPIKRSKTYKPLEGESNIRPKSARSKFLLGCISQGISPHPSLIIRKHATINLCLSNFNIGDKVGIILSECLETLPLLQGLAIDDNNLTDKSLVPIIKALSNCFMLQSFNISRNKVDSLTANALLEYLSSSTCNLIQLIMSTADIDDYEASRFMLAIINKPSLRELDLSSNLIGSHEFALKKNQDTGGVAIGMIR